MARKRKFGSRRRHHSRRHRFNPLGSLSGLPGAFTAGYNIETAKMAGSVLAGGIGTMFVSNLVLDKVVGMVMKRNTDELLTRIVDFLATGLVAGGIATGSRYVMPFRSNEVLAGGMLAAFSRLLPPKWTGGAALAPGMKGWSNELGLESMNLDGLNDYTSFPQIANPLRMNGMGDFVSVPQVGMAPQLIAGLGDFAMPRQAGAPVMAGMDAIVAGEIG
jgi:hypothetical protein